MGGSFTLGVLSDIHYACEAEQARGHNYESLGVPNLFLRTFLRFYRHFIWLRDPLEKSYLLDRFLEQAGSLDYLVLNGDYTCDTAFVGVSDDACCQSVRECLAKLRTAFPDNLSATYGDHDLGKVSFFGGHGGMRIASWHRARKELGLEPFWQVRIGKYVLMGVVSSLIGLPIFEADTLPAERAEWNQLRREHLADVCSGFENLKPQERLLLFCHDPTALHYLAQEPVVQARFSQIEQTIIGHLHTNLVLWKSRWLAGMPRIDFLGHTVRRLSSALRQARDWQPFKVRLCPALAGVELLKDGGYLTIELDPDARTASRLRFHPITRRR